MARPNDYLPWCTITTYYSITVNGITHSVINSKAPVVGDLNHDFTSRGATKGIGVPVQYVNYQLNGYYKWILHLNGRMSIGDIFRTNNNLSVAQVNQQLGGTWVYIGLKVVGGNTQYFWKKLI